MSTTFPLSQQTFSNESAVTFGSFAKQNDLYDTVEAIENEVGYTGDTASDAGSIHSQLKNVQSIGPHLRGTVAAAAAITLTNTTTVIVTGTTTITSIVATGNDTGREVTLEVTGICQITDGSNIDIEGNFTGPGRIGLECDGTNWKEVARSNPSATVADGSITLAKLAADSVNAAKIVDDSITAAEINTSIKDGPAANPSLRSLGVSSSQASPGNHTHAGFPGLDVQDEGTLQGNILTMNIVGAGATVAVGGGVATLTIAGASLPIYATMMKFGID